LTFKRRRQGVRVKKVSDGIALEPLSR
jgi:hypothetical protein